ncbi:MAG: shikimate dehydrogenase [Nitrospirae bacterium]|nr:shikimate dehydrogenase [Nitrospirota bacterium]
MRINASTKITGIIGWPVEHSKSPLMHNAAFDALGLNFCYIAMPVKPEALEEAIKGIKALNFLGINVTIPHKETVMKYLDRIDEEARFIGAVNTIKNEDGMLVGYNTDGRGFMESLTEEGIDTTGKNVFIVGVGGAARAVSYYLCQKAARLWLHGRNMQKATALANDLKKISSCVAVTETKDNIQFADIIINATPLGMKDTDPLPFDPERLRKDQVVCDLIYWETPLLRAARQQGCKTIDGLGMLLWQGVLAFKIWTGIKPPIELMREHLKKSL